MDFWPMIDYWDDPPSILECQIGSFNNLETSEVDAKLLDVGYNVKPCCADEKLLTNLDGTRLIFGRPHCLQAPPHYRPDGQTAYHTIKPLGKQEGGFYFADLSKVLLVDHDIYKVTPPTPPKTTPTPPPPSLNNHSRTCLPTSRAHIQPARPVAHSFA